MSLVAATNEGTLVNRTDATRPSTMWATVRRRPDGTSTTTSTSPLSGAVIRPVSMAQVVMAMVPWPQAVEKPSLWKNTMPTSPPASSGGTTMPPYMSAWPRGSWQRNRRWSSRFCIAQDRLSRTESPCISPRSTIRKGSPAVW